jgi:hypothetical protein
MQFHIDEDRGASIAGWVVPDNPGAVPKIVILADGGEAVTIEANRMRADIKDLGLHRTGMVGFDVDERIYPGLAGARNVRLWEAESRGLIYGRFDPERHVELKLLYYELSAMPQTRLGASMQRRFAMPYQAVERLPFDSLFAVINSQFARSIYLSGRPHYKRYQHLLADNGFHVVAMLRDPYEELAERLLFARYAARADTPRHFIQHLSGLGPLVELASAFDVSSEQAMLTAFRSLTPEHEQALANPFVRALACEFDEPAERRHVGVALDNLASMNLVGLRQRFDTFKSMLQELVGIDLLDEGEPVEVSWVPDIAAKLARIDKVNSLLALDVMLYNLARDAIRKAVSIA